MKQTGSWMAQRIPYNDKISFSQFSENFTSAIMASSGTPFNCYIMVETTKNIPYIHEIKTSSLLHKYYAINAKDHCKGFKDTLELYDKLRELYELDNILLVMIVDNNVTTEDDEEYNQNKGHKLLSMWHDKDGVCKSYLYDTEKMSFNNFRKSDHVFEKLKEMGETGNVDEFLRSGPDGEDDE